MTKKQLKKQYLEWNKEISLLPVQNDKISREIQDLCVEYGLPATCCIQRNIENLIKVGEVYSSLSLYAQYCSNEGEYKALRDFAYRTENFNI